MLFSFFFALTGSGKACAPISHSGTKMPLSPVTGICEENRRYLCVKRSQLGTRAIDYCCTSGNNSIWIGAKIAETVYLPLKNILICQLVECLIPAMKQKPISGVLMQSFNFSTNIKPYWFWWFFVYIAAKLEFSIYDLYFCTLKLQNSMK